jgi:signal peptidase II
MDLFTKHLAQTLLPFGHPVPVLPFFSLTYVMNTGAAFSMLAGLPLAVRLPFFSLVTVLALAAVWLYWKELRGRRDGWMELALGLILGGALGNFVDRVRYGQVVDFLEFFWPGWWNFPVFNAADSAVCVGVGILILKTFLEPKKCTP